MTTYNAQQLDEAVHTGSLAPDARIVMPAVGDGVDHYGESGFLPLGSYRALSAAESLAYDRWRDGDQAAMDTQTALCVRTATSVLWSIQNEYESGGA
jgi:hypothetical protein